MVDILKQVAMVIVKVSGLEFTQRRREYFDCLAMQTTKYQYYFIILSIFSITPVLAACACQYYPAFASPPLPSPFPSPFPLGRYAG